MTVCAAFIEESRMRLASATKLDRKSGGAQPRDLQFVGGQKEPAGNSPMGHSLRPKVKLQVSRLPRTAHSRLRNGAACAIFL